MHGGGAGGGGGGIGGGGGGGPKDPLEVSWDDTNRATETCYEPGSKV